MAVIVCGLQFVCLKPAPGLGVNIPIAKVNLLLSLSGFLLTASCAEESVLDDGLALALLIV